MFKAVLLCYHLRSGPFNYTYDITHLTYAEDLLLLKAEYALHKKIMVMS